jgi:uncharacterized repeat protein (TIGR03803 family)
MVNGGTAPVAGAFTYSTADGTLLAVGNDQSEAVTFTPNDTADYPTVMTTVIVNVAQATPSTSLNAVNITYGTALNNDQLSGTATWFVNGVMMPVGGTFAYAPSDPTVPNAGADQAEAVIFTPTDLTDYTTVTTSVILNVSQATPDVSLNPVDIPYGTALANSQLIGSATWVVNGVTMPVAGTFAYTTAAGTLLGAGNDQSEAVTFTPNDKTDYITVTTTVIVNVAQATPVVTVNAVNITYGTALINNQLSGIETAAGTLTYAPSDPVLLNAGDDQLESVIFTPTDTTDYETVTTSVIVNVAQATPVVSVNPLSFTYGTAFDSSQLSGTATWVVDNSQNPVPGTFIYTIASGTVPLAGDNQTESVLFIPHDLTDYMITRTSVIVNVAQATPIVSVNPVNIAFGMPLNSSQLNGTATWVVAGTSEGVPGAFTYTTAANTVLHAGAGQTESVTFTPKDTIDYTSATTTVIVNVSQSTPTVSVNPVNITYGTALDNSQLTGTATLTFGRNLYEAAGTLTYTTAVGALLDAGNGYVEDVTFTPTDTTDYTSATGTVIVNVAQAMPNFSLTAVNITYGTALNNNQLNGTATWTVGNSSMSVAGTFTYAPTDPIVPAAGSNQSEAVIFTPNDKTDYAVTPTTVIVNVGQAAPNVSASTINITYGTTLTNNLLGVAATWVVGNSAENVPGMFTFAPIYLNYLPFAGDGQTVVAIFKPTDSTDYTSVNVPVTLNVAQATPSVSVNPQDITYGTALDSNQLQGTATWVVSGSKVNVAGKFAYASTDPLVPGVGIDSEAVIFTPTDTIDYMSVSTFQILIVVKVTPNVSVNPVNLAYGTALNNLQLNGTATWVVDNATVTVRGTFAYASSVLGTVPPAGVASEPVVFTPNDLGDYSDAYPFATVTVTDETSINLKTSLNFVAPGYPVTLTATVTAASGTPGGTIEFDENGEPTQQATLVNGVASITIDVPAGSSSYTAVYSATSSFGGSTSNTVYEVATSLNQVDLGDPGNGAGALILDPKGDLYGTTTYGGSYGYGSVFEILAGTNMPITLASFGETVTFPPTFGFPETGQMYQPMGQLAMDAQGDLFGMACGTIDVIEEGSCAWELPHGSNSLIDLTDPVFNNDYFSEFQSEWFPLDEAPAVATDGRGDVYIRTPPFNKGPDNVGLVEVPAGGTSASSVSVGNFGDIGAITSDPLGNVYFLNGNALYEIGSSGTAPEMLGDIASNGDSFDTIAVDANGNIYATGTEANGQLNATIFRVVEQSGTYDAVPDVSFSEVGALFNLPNLTFDSHGNVYGAMLTGLTYNEYGSFNGYSGSADGFVFEIKKGSQTPEILANPGALLVCNVVVDPQGNIYGETNDGPVYELTPGVLGTVVNAAWAQGYSPAEPIAVDFSPTLYFGYDAFSAVQPALDATAVGGTVEIDPGTYSGQISITQDVTINGSDQGLDEVDTTLQAPSGLAGDEINIASGITASLQDFAVNARTGTVVGIDDDGGTVFASDLTISNCSDGILVQNGGTLTTADDTIDDNVTGVTVQTSSTAAFGDVYDPDLSPDAIIGGTVSDNTVGFDVENDSSLTVTDTSVTSNGTGFLVGTSATDVSFLAASYNIITGDGVGVQSAGLHGEVVATFDWWGTASGPYNVNNPSGTGPSVTGVVTFSPWLGDDNTSSPDNLRFLSLHGNLYNVTPNSANNGLDITLGGETVGQAAFGVLVYFTGSGGTVTVEGEMTSANVFDLMDNQVQYEAAQGLTGQLVTFLASAITCNVDANGASNTFNILGTGAGAEINLNGGGSPSLYNFSGSSVLPGSINSGFPATLSYAAYGSGVNVNLGNGTNGTATGVSGKVAAAVTTVIGSNFYDNLNAGSVPNVALSGGPGNNTLSGTGSGDSVVERTTGATLANTLLTGSNFSDILSGITVANLTDAVGGNTFTASGWTGTGSLTAPAADPDGFVVRKSANFTLSGAPNASTITASDGMSLTLNNVDDPDLTATTAGNMFTLKNWSGAATLNGTNAFLVMNRAGGLTLSNSNLDFGSTVVTLSGITTANLTDLGNQNTYALAGWTGNGTLIGADDTLSDTVSSSLALNNTSLAVSGLPILTLSGFISANLSDNGSGNTFTMNGWTGAATLTGMNDTVSDSSIGGYTLGNSSLYSAATGQTFHFSGIATADLTDQGSGNTFTVTGWTGTGALNGSGDTVVDAAFGSFTLSNTLLSIGTMSMQLSGITEAQLNDFTFGGGDTFTLSNWTGSGDLVGLGDTLTATESTNMALNNATFIAGPTGRMMLSGIIHANLTAGTTSATAAPIVVDASAFSAGTTNLSVSGPGSAILFGGAAGDDMLSIQPGASGNNVLIGTGAGDIITDSGSGRSILIGAGPGGDTIAGDGNDILVSGTTAFDKNTTTDIAALEAILGEWATSDTYSRRIDAVEDIGATNLDTLNATTVTANANLSTLEDTPGETANQNLFIASTQDVVHDPNFEVITYLPTVQGYITPVAPNSRNTAVSSIDVTFSTAIAPATLTTSALTLKDDGGPNLIGPGVSISPLGGNSYQVNGLSGLTGSGGIYVFTVNGADINKASGGALGGSLTTSWLMDTTAPTSHVMNSLGATQTSDSFAVPVTFTDPAGAGGSSASGVAMVELFVSVNNGPFTQSQALTFATPETSGTVTFTFLGHDRNVYAFHSISIDAAGNTESKTSTTTEASTSVPDLNPPVTHVLASSSYSSGVFTLNWSGTDPDQNSGNPEGSISLENIYVIVDNGTPKLVNQVSAGTPDASGVYSGELSYSGLADGKSHTYGFYSIGIDNEGKTQATPAVPDVSYSGISYSAPLAVQKLVVEDGIAERSFIQYLDVDFSQTTATSAALSSLAAELSTTGSSRNSYVELLWYGENLTTISAPVGSVNLFNAGTTATVGLTGNDLSINFGPNGITSLLSGVSGKSTTNAGDGWYALGIDPTGNASNGQVFWEPFFRLFGSATGDETVSGPYTTLGTDAYVVYRAEGQKGSPLNGDVDGNGVVNAMDFADTVKYGTAPTQDSVGATAPTNFPQFQLFAGARVAPPGQPAVVTQSELQSLLPDAIAAWQAAGLDASDVRRLESVPVEVENLGSSILGLETAGVITINQSAAGYRWYTGAAVTPANDVSLLTVLEHELGHVLGLADNNEPGDLMDTTLGLGVMRTPTTADLASVVPPSGVIVTAPIVGTVKTLSLPASTALGQDTQSLVDAALASIADITDDSGRHTEETGKNVALAKRSAPFLRILPTSRVQRQSSYVSMFYPVGARSALFGPKMVNSDIEKDNVK